MSRQVMSPKLKVKSAAALARPPPKVEPQGADIRVLTFNVFVGPGTEGRGWLVADTERLESQLRAVRAVNADVVCLQELLEDTVCERYRQAFPDYTLVVMQNPWPQTLCRWLWWHVVSAVFALLFASPLVLAHMLQPTTTRKLLAAGVWMFFRFAVARWFATGAQLGGWSMPRAAVYDYLHSRSAGCAIMVRNELGAIKEEHTGWYEFLGSWWPYRSDEAMINGVRWVQGVNMERYLGVFQRRGFQFVEVAVSLPGRGGTRRLRVVNTHWNIGVVNHPRIAQARETLSRAVGECSCAVVLCGDFNADVSLPEIQHLIGAAEELRLNDAWADSDGRHGRKVDDLGATWSESNPMTKGLLIEPEQRLDLVLYTKQRGLSANSCDVVFEELAREGIPVSDHYGVLAELTLLSNSKC